MSLLVAPSLLAVWENSGGDTGAVVLAAKQAARAGADWLHVDVMDGVYVPAKAFGVDVVENLQGIGVLDVHLMVDRPENVVQSYLRAGADRLVFHPSTSDDILGTLQEINDFGATGGLALNIDEDVKWLEPWVENPDQTLVKQVLVMTVKAGAGGQVFREDMLEKIALVRRMVGPNVSVVVDGGINAHTAKLSAQAGADCVVAGSYIFKSPTPQTAIQSLRSA